jgi:hypothetical protein
MADSEFGRPVMVSETQMPEGKRSRAGTHDPFGYRSGQALPRGGLHLSLLAAGSICVNLRNLRIHRLRLGRRGSADIVMQNKANFHQGGSASSNVVTKGYERNGCSVSARKQSQFAALRLLRRFAARNDMITHVLSDGGRHACASAGMAPGFRGG